jgi:acetylornithine deacetylase/succinyl-diaminopimelate desuccinylase-like protein
VGTESIGQLAAELCKGAQLDVELQPDRQDGLSQLNVLAEIKAKTDSPGLMLLTHLDTADPGTYASWTKTSENPFNASIYQDQMYGLGVTAKLDFICKLEALKQIDRSKLKRNIQLVGTFGEENGMLGAMRLVRHKKIRSQWALIGEPTDLKISNASLGFAVVEVQVPFSPDEIQHRRQHLEQELSSSQSKLFYGKPAHSSHPKLGENAIVTMLNYLANLPEGVLVLEMDGGLSVNVVPESAHLEIDVMGELRDGLSPKLRTIMQALQQVEEDFYNYPAQGFLPDVPTMNIGLVRTQEEHVLLRGSCRLPPSVEESTYQAWIEILRKGCQSVGAHFRVAEYKRPFEVPSKQNFIEQCRAENEKQGRSGEFVKISSCTEASIFSRMGLECVVFGPGQGVGNSHRPNEWISIKDLQYAVDFYRGMIERMCF